MDLLRVTKRLSTSMEVFDYGERIKYIYNPMNYAARPYANYFRMFGQPPKEIIMVGMNPGPWGMAQTGVPFGEVNIVRDWMGIKGSVGKPDFEHPKRPVMGFECTRSEVSGRRLWGWARERYKNAEDFFARFFVVNYCPLIFFDTEGRNITPDKLPVAAREKLFEQCDTILRNTIQYFSPSYVVGIGVFAHGRCLESLSESGIKAGRISHPSPANPAANRGWADVIEKELSEIGVVL